MFFTTSTFFRILFKLFFMFTTGANFVLSWTGNCSSSCVMHLMGLLNILIWLDGSFQCLWLVFEGLFNLHWTDVTDAFHNMLLLKFNDWDEPFVLLNILWMTMLTGILDHSVVYIDSCNDCCVYKVLAETFWNYKTVPNINLPNIDDTCIYLRLFKWKVNFIYIVRFTCKWKVCLMKKYSKELRFIILWYIK